MMDEYWQSYQFKDIDKLKNLVKKIPISDERLAILVSNNNIFLSLINTKGRGVCIYHGCKSEKPRYQILINNNDSYEEQVKTLAHELVHIFYRCTFSGTREEVAKLELVINEEAERIRRHLPSTIKRLYEELPNE